MKYIDAEKLIAEIERLQKFNNSMSNNAINSNMRNFYDGEEDCCKQLLFFIDSLQQEQPEVFDTVAFQKDVQEGRRLEREDALTIADIEKLHTFLYAVKNNKQEMFTFTRLTNEQYEEVLRRFNKAKSRS